ncbi:spore coat protein [Bacillus halotolerans]|nr:spore coat protein [Bacillus halotolerans]
MPLFQYHPLQTQAFSQLSDRKIWLRCNCSVQIHTSL